MNDPISSSMNTRQDLASMGTGFTILSGRVKMTGWRGSQVSLHLLQAAFKSHPEDDSTESEPLLVISHALDQEPDLKRDKVFPLRLVSVLRRGTSAKQKDPGNRECYFGVSFRSPPFQPVPEQQPRELKLAWQYETDERRYTYEFKLNRRPKSLDKTELWFQAFSLEDAQQWNLALEKATRMAFLTQKSILPGEAQLMPTLLRLHSAELFFQEPVVPYFFIFHSGLRASYTRAISLPEPFEWNETHIFYLTPTSTVIGNLYARASWRMIPRHLLYFILPISTILDDLVPLSWSHDLDVILPLCDTALSEHRGRVSIGVSVLHFPTTV